jgi:hypothetical protein
MNGYSGKKPKGSDGWIPVRKFSINGKTWEMFDNPSKGFNDWIMLKLIITSGSHRKANFFTGYNPVENRISVTRCWEKLLKHHPDVANAVATYLVDEY